jgi:TolB protein
MLSTQVVLVGSIIVLLGVGCGGTEPPPETGGTAAPGPDTAPTRPAAEYRPDVAPVASIPGRVRSLAALPDGSWLLSRLFGTGASPATIAAGATTVTPTPGWSPLEVLAIRPSPDGAQLAWTRMADQSGGEVWVRPAAGGEGRRVSAGYMLAWLDPGHLLVMTGSETSIAQATLDVVDVATGAARTVVRPIEGRLFRGAAASPDGANIAFLAFPAGDSSSIEASDVYVVPAAGGEPRQLTTDGAGCLDLAWTPDGQLVLHSAQRGASRDIWAVPAAGGAPVLVASTPGEDGVPAVARDGRTLRFASFGGGSARVLGWEVGRAGGPRVLSEGDADRGDPSLSPDGFRFAYVLSSGRASNVMMGKIADGTSRPLTETAETESMPVFSPDGSSLAYLSRREGGVEIVLHLLRAGEETPAVIRRSEAPLTTGANVDPRRRPAFSADGRQLLFAAYRAGKRALMRVPVGGGDPVEVAPEVLSYAWDPRQPAILYVRPKEGGGVELVRIRLEGRRPPEVLRVDARRLDLVGAATGANAVYAFEESDRMRLVKVDLATGRRDPLVDLPEATDFFRLGADVSPDGRFVAATIAEVTTDLHEVRNFGGMPR